jgi:hypothetical protein
MHDELLRALEFWERFNRRRAAEAKARNDLFLHFNAKADAYKNCAAALRGDSTLINMAEHYQREEATR